MFIDFYIDFNDILFKKWVKKDLDSQILKQEAVNLQNTIENVQSISKIAIEW